MIVARLELHSAITGKVTELGVVRIANVGGDSHLNDYEVRVQRRNERELPNTPADFEGWNKPTTRTGEVRQYPRLSYNVWRLVLRALKATFPEEK